MKSLIPRPVRKTSQSPSPSPRSSAQPSHAQRALSPGARPPSVSSSTNTTHSRAFNPMSPPKAAPAVIAQDQALEAMLPQLDRVKSPTPTPPTAARRSRGSWLIGGTGGKGVSVSSKEGKSGDRKSKQGGGGHVRGTSISSVDFGADARDSLCCGDTIADEISTADSASLIHPSPPPSITSSPRKSSHKSHKKASKEVVNGSGGLVVNGSVPAPGPQPPLTPPPSASATGKSFTVIGGSRMRASPPQQPPQPHPPVQAERSYFSQPVTPPETATSLLHSIAAGSTQSSASPKHGRHPFAVPISPGPPVRHTPMDDSGPTTPTAQSKTHQGDIKRPVRSIHRASTTSLRPRQSPSRDDIPTILSLSADTLTPQSPTVVEKDPRSVLPPDNDTRYQPSPSIADVLSDFVAVSPGPRVKTPEVSRDPSLSRRQSEQAEIGGFASVGDGKTSKSSEDDKSKEVVEETVESSKTDQTKEATANMDASNAGKASSQRDIAEDTKSNDIEAVTMPSASTPRSNSMSAIVHDTALPGSVSKANATPTAPPPNPLLPGVLRPRLAIELSWQDNIFPSIGLKSVSTSPAPAMRRSSTTPSLFSMQDSSKPKAAPEGLGKPPLERVTLPRESSRRTSLRFASQTAADAAVYGVGFIPLRGPRTRLSSLIEPWASAPRPGSEAAKRDLRGTI